jgi:hypothetical protein
MNFVMLAASEQQFTPGLGTDEPGDKQPNAAVLLSSSNEMALTHFLISHRSCRAGESQSVTECLEDLLPFLSPKSLSKGERCTPCGGSTRHLKTRKQKSLLGIDFQHNRRMQRTKVQYCAPKHQ